MDDGYSGIDRCRPEFNRLLKDCANGNITVVLCKDQSRFSRDIVVIEQYINDKFLEWGVRFIGVADNADSDSEMYGTMRIFTSAYNEMYVKDISSKIRRTLTFKREQGQFVGSFAPYGYKIDPQDKHHLIIDDEAAPVVRLIFEMYIQGCGYRKIVQELNDRSILCPSEYKKQNGSNYINCNADLSRSKGLWTQSTIYSILHNEMYTGTMVQGKSHHISYKNKRRKKVSRDDWVRIPNTHEPVIAPETWKLARDRLDSRTRVNREIAELPPLSGKVKCAVCGSPMKRNVYYNSSKTIKYYGLQCGTYKSGAMNCPNSRSISGKALEAKIIEELNLIIAEHCQTDLIHIEDLYAKQLAALEKELAECEKKLELNDSRLEKMYIDKLDGIIDDRQYAKFNTKLNDETSTIKMCIDDLRLRIEALNAKRPDAEDQRSIIKKYTSFTTLDRTITDEFIDCIEIGEVSGSGDREIHIYWRI